MVEVFKTNVSSYRNAELLTKEILKNFTDYSINFDLLDCDNILRVECRLGFINPSSIIKIVRDNGFEAEVLIDEVPELIK